MKENLEEIEDSVRDTLGLVNDLDLEDAGKNLFQAVESLQDALAAALYAINDAKAECK